MSEILSAARPDFFGKDSFTPFIGVVEDVNDPTHSGRVKVRCMGWHPFGSEGEDLPVDDLPWARVGMPTTHAQQSRIGGKHGLLPGCYVFGFFMDGDEAQDPFILSTFNFTSKTSDRDNRKNVLGEDGKVGEQYEPGDKTLTSPATQPNTSLRRADEKQQEGFSAQSDTAGDNVNEDSDNPQCGGQAPNSSAAEDAQRDEFKNPGNTVGNVYEVDFADGGCGSNAHQQQDIQRKLQERMPSQFDRFVFGDAVWERFSGNFIDMNGVLAQLAIEICSLLKQFVESVKSEQEEKMFRQTKGAELVAVPGRNPEPREKVDDTQRRRSDIFHALVGAIIDQLCMLVMDLLVELQNGGEEYTDNENSGGSDSDGGKGGANPVTRINDPGAPCVAETFSKNFEKIINKGMQDALVESDRLIQESNDNNDDGGASLDNIVGGILSIIGAFASGSGLIFPLVDKYTEKTELFNSQGNKSQDQRKRQGCRQERVYNTEQGAAGALGFIQAMMSAAQSQGGGGGSDQSNSGNTQRNKGGSVTISVTDDEIRRAWVQTGVQRSAVITTEEENGQGIDNSICEDGQTTKIKDPKPGDSSTKDPNELNLGNIWIEGPCNVYANKAYTFRVKNDGPEKIKDSYFAVLKRFGPAGDDAYYSTEYSEIKQSRSKNRAEITFQRGLTTEDKNIFIIYCYVWALKNKKKGTYFRRKAKLKVRAYDQFVNIENLECPPAEKGDPIDPEDLTPPTEFPEDNPESGGTTNTPTNEGIIPGLNTVPTEFPEDNPESGGTTNTPTTVSSGTNGRNTGVVDTNPLRGDGIIPGLNTVPSGTNGSATAVSLPSGNQAQGKNFRDGTPNVIVVQNPGQNYNYRNDIDPTRVFPDIYIPGYSGDPTPVINRDTGEIVAIITVPEAFDPNRPLAPVSIIPSNSQNGIYSDDPNYDIEVVGFLIQNTGFNYIFPELKLYDLDKESYTNGEFRCKLVNGRIVGVDIINSGTGFLRIPRVDITDMSDSRGYGAKLYPIMGVLPKVDSKEALPPEVVDLVYCPAKDQTNIYTGRRDPMQTVSRIVTRVANEIRTEASLPVPVTPVPTTPVPTPVVPTPVVPTPTPYVPPTPSTPTPPTPTPPTPTPTPPTPSPTPPTPTPPAPSPTPTPPSPSPPYGGGYY